MSDTVLTNWTIYYDEAAANNVGYKQIRWTGTTGTNTVNELFTAIIHLFNDPSNQTGWVDEFNNTTPMIAVTPTLYEIGAFDAGDVEPWFIDPESIKHLTGSGINTTGWSRITGTQAGIVKVGVTITSNFVTNDLGRVVTDGTSSGRLLYFDNAAGEIWVRPTDETSTHDWSGTAAVSTTGGTGAASAHTAATTGEMVWTNPFTIGTLASNTRLYTAQNNTVISNIEDSGSGPWWSDGQIDVLLLTTDQNSVIDKGLVTFYARQFTKTYDHFIADLSGGGRTPIPFSTGDDVNNDSGIRTASVTGASGAFSQGEVVTGGTTGAKGVVTENTGSPTTAFDYYLVDDLTDFNSSETLSGSIVGSNGSMNGTTTVKTGGVDDSLGITLTFGEIDESFNTSLISSNIITTATTHPFVTEDAIIYTKDGGSDAIGLTEGNTYFVRNLSTTTVSLHPTATDATNNTNIITLSTGTETHRLIKAYDIDQDDTAERYSIAINCNSVSLSLVYEYLKFILRRGETTTYNGIEGQQFIGIDYRVDYVTLTGTIATGATVTQTASDGSITTAYVVHHNTESNYVMLRDTNGILEISANNLEVDGSNYITMSTATVETITPIKVNSFGTFAGGRFFGSRGVVLYNVPGADANNYEVIDDTGTSYSEPTSVPITITAQTVNGTKIAGARIAVYRQDTGAALIDTTSDSNGQASTTFIYISDVAVYVRIRQSTQVSSFDTSQAFTSNVITLDAATVYEDGEAVVYSKDGGSAVVGLTDGSTYYVNYITDTTISLHTSASNAISDTSRVTMSTNGTETHTLTSTRYIPLSTSGTIGSSGLSITATLTVDGAS